MKRSISTPITATALFAMLAVPIGVIAQQPAAAPPENSRLGRSTPTRYSIVDLGAVGGPPGQPYHITDNALVGGAAQIPSGAMHAVLWYKGHETDIGAPGLGGLNSAAFGVNAWGQAVGQAQTPDSNDEDFCGFNAYGLPPSNTKCLPFVWQYGRMIPLPTLGGANGYAYMINNSGETVGLAENNTKDPACPVFNFEPVVWKGARIHELHTFPGDPVGVAAAVNDKGQVSGASGTCAPVFNPNSGLYLVEDHALLWENATAAPTDLGNLGGTGGIAGNHACALNNQGQVVGHSELTNNTTFHGFLWTKETLMQDLGTLCPKDLGTACNAYASLGLGINNQGTVVGASLDPEFNPTAFVWKSGLMTDLNTLVSGSSDLYLLLAFAINEPGEIVGLGVTSSGEVDGFLAIPADSDPDAGDAAAAKGASGETPKPPLSESARQLLRKQLALRYHVGGLQ